MFFAVIESGFTGRHGHRESVYAICPWVQCNLSRKCELELTNGSRLSKAYQQVDNQCLLSLSQPRYDNLQTVLISMRCCSPLFCPEA
jgi:hypothetical protein